MKTTSTSPVLTSKRSLPVYRNKNGQFTTAPGEEDATKKSDFETHRRSSSSSSLDRRERTDSQYSSSSNSVGNATSSLSNNPNFLIWRPTIRSSRHSSTSTVSSRSSTTDSDLNHQATTTTTTTNNVKTDENQRNIVPKITIRMRSEPILFEKFGQIQSSKSSLININLENGKRTLLETSSLSSNKRRKV